MKISAFNRKGLYFFVGFGMLFTFYTLFRLYGLGAWQTVSDQPLAALSYLEGIPGPEDLQIDRAGKYLYIASEDRWAQEMGKAERGAIYKLNIQEDKAKPQLISPAQPEDFHPHGLHLYSDPAGKQTLFVVNHRESGKQSIEIFDLNDRGQLSYRESIFHPNLVWPNDVLGLSHSTFYVTNVSGYGPNFGRKMDAFLNLRGGSISYFDGEDMQKVASQLAFPNGLALSKDGQTLYVSETIAGNISQYQRQSNNNQLTFLRSDFVQRGVDNLDVDLQGDVWVAAQPNLLALAQHIKNPKALSPSQLYVVNPKNGRARLVYSNQGAALSGISVGVYYNQQIWMGVFCDSKIAYCPKYLK